MQSLLMHLILTFAVVMVITGVIVAVFQVSVPTGLGMASLFYLFHKLVRLQEFFSEIFAQGIEKDK